MKRVLAYMYSFAFCGMLLAEERTVSSVAGLVAALDELKDDAANTVILQPGSYDVSECAMMCNDADKAKYLWPTSHVAVSRLTLKGGGNSPDETVIYGDRSQRVVYMWQGRLENLTISNGCTRAGENVGGGGVLARNTGSVLSNVVIVCCKAYSGGGVSMATCIDSTVSKCLADEHSGGMGSCTIVGGEISDNESKKYGGGCAWSTCTGVDILRNKAGTLGGGVFCSTVKGGSIAGNFSQTGGGGACYNQKGGYSIQGCIIVSNSTAGVGGGLSFSGDAVRSLLVSRCDILHNRSSGNGGGVAYGKLVDGCVVSNNVCDAAAGASAYGGGLYECHAFDSTITHNLITTEYSLPAICGGGLYKGMASNSVVSGNAVALCSATSMIGGGGYETAFADCRIFGNFSKVGAAMNGGSASGCVISNNFSHNGRHAIRAVTSLSGCDVWNAAIDTAGAVMNTSVRGYGTGWDIAPGENVYTNGYFAPASGDLHLIAGTQGKTSLTNCLLAGNVCTTLMFRPDSNPPSTRMVNCTFADNCISSVAGGFNFTAGSQIEFVNCIIACNSNSTGTAAYDMSLFHEGDTNVVFRNCMIDPRRTAGWTPQEEVGTVSAADPKFDRKDEWHPYSLRRSSPALGKGLVQDWMAYATDIRRDGQFSRLLDGKVDIGCYQCHLKPTGTAIVLR